MPDGLLDVVCPVKVARSNEELRYALRSWAARLPHRRVWLVGRRPWWASAEADHIPTVQAQDKWENTTTAMRAACDHPDVSDPFVWVNDDMFTMRPLPDGVPVLHRGPLRQVEQQLAARGYRGVYVDAMRAARELLQGLGYAGPLCYEPHVPLVVEKAGMVKALEVGAGLDAMKRSVYGNLTGIGGDLVEDVKIMHRRPQGFGPDSVFLSTMPDAFANGAVGRFIREAFPDRCRYEKGGPR